MDADDLVALEDVRPAGNPLEAVPSGHSSQSP
jgi:hypothetical protein